VIEVVSVAGPATVQDGGRAGHMHEGVPPGGALVPELLARANAATHNPLGESAIEIVGAITLRARDELVAADDDCMVRVLHAGETWTTACSGARVRYIALRGGIGVPRVLGGRGTLLVAGLGGHEGRALRRGDVLPLGNAPPSAEAQPPVAPNLRSPIGVILGPDGDRFDAHAVDVLLSSTFHVEARSDRVGIRLAGPRLARSHPDTGVSAPMVRGAIQVPPSGEPIVLGPDHPTTGGYPVLATVLSSQFGALAARPIGAPVQFVAVQSLIPLARRD